MSDIEVPSLEEIITKLKRVENIRDKALISFLYLSGARVSEIVMRFKVKNISVEKEGERLFYVFHIYTEKRREKTAVYRRVGIPYDNNKFFIDTILDYLKRYDYGKEDYLFPVNRRTAHRIVKRYFSFHTHFLRHTRVTHLTTMYGLNAPELQRYIGWSDIKTASTYIHLNWRDVSHKL